MRHRRIKKSGCLAASHPALSQQTPERVPRRRLHYGIESPPGGVIDVKVGWDEIQIASECDRLAGRIKSFRVSAETLEPQELLIKIGDPTGFPLGR